jgi:hypothetical protein
MSADQLQKVIGRTRNLQLTEDQHREIEDFIQMKLSQRASRRDRAQSARPAASHR